MIRLENRDKIVDAIKKDVSRLLSRSELLQKTGLNKKTLDKHLKSLVENETLVCKRGIYAINQNVTIGISDKITKQRLKEIRKLSRQITAYLNKKESYHVRKHHKS